MTIQKLSIRERLMEYWKEHPRSLAQLSRDMNMCIYTLRRVFYSDCKIQPKTLMKIELFLKDK